MAEAGLKVEVTNARASAGLVHGIAQYWYSKTFSVFSRQQNWRSSKPGVRASSWIAQGRPVKCKAVVPWYENCLLHCEKTGNTVASRAKTRNAVRNFVVSKLIAPQRMQQRTAAVAAKRWPKRHRWSHYGEPAPSEGSDAKLSKTRCFDPLKANGKDVKWLHVVDWNLQKKIHSYLLPLITCLWHTFYIFIILMTTYVLHLVAYLHAVYSSS